jgi:PRTRC genetic system protein C
MERRILVGEYMYNGMKLPAPNPEMTPEQVREAYLAAYPELATAAIEGPEISGDKMTYRFVRAVGAKG